MKTFHRLLPIQIQFIDDNGVEQLIELHEYAMEMTSFDVEITELKKQYTLYKTRLLDIFER